MVGEEYDFSVEATGKETVVAAYPRRGVELAANSDSDLAGQIYRMAFEAISRLQSQLLIVGRITAVDEKVGSFVLEPSAQEENEFLRLHCFEEYCKWHLGINDEKPADTATL